MVTNVTQATISVQLIEFEYMLELCMQDPNRFFLDLYYRTSNRLFKFNITREGLIQNYLSAQNGHPLKPFTAWKSLYELAHRDPKRVSREVFLTNLEQLIKSLEDLKDSASLSSREPQCANLSQRIECLNKIMDLIKNNRTYPSNVVTGGKWVCPLLEKNCNGNSHCGYGRLSSAYKKGEGFLSEEDLSKLPRPEAVIYQYLYERQRH